jgi:acyl-coenzyme A thioesterase PaaI-like protein
MIKQFSSKMCFVCGLDNPIGLRLTFWVDGDTVWTEFTPAEEYQGYPGVLHGGITATLLDETMGRVAALRNLWMVTVKMELTYRKPVPLGQPLRITARMEELHGRRMTTVGEILLPDGTVAVEAKGLYLRLPEERKERFLAELQAQGFDVSAYV